MKFTEKLLETKRINKEFLHMINCLSMEEIITIKLELCKKFFHVQDVHTLGINLFNYIESIIKKSFINIYSKEYILKNINIKEKECNHILDV